MKIVNGLEYHYLEAQSEEWLESRRTMGIGSSEIGTVLGLNPYGSRAVLFYKKTGLYDKDKPSNERMNHGIFLEEYIAKCWQAYDGTIEGMFNNMRNRVKVRKARNVNAIIRNPKYPFLIANIDREMVADTALKIENGEKVEGGIIECKMLSHWAAQMWEEKIPPSYVAQVQHQMLVMERTYAEMAVLKDGNQFLCYPIEYSGIICANIISEGKKFWDAVVRVREEKAKYEREQISYTEFMTTVQYNEPEPDSSEEYKEYLNQSYVKEYEFKQGDEHHFTAANREKFLSKVSKQLEKKIDEKSAAIRKFMVTESVEKMLFDNYGGGYVSLKTKKGGKNPTLLNNVKGDFGDSDVEAAVQHITDFMENFI